MRNPTVEVSVKNGALIARFVAADLLKGKADFAKSLQSLTSETPKLNEQILSRISQHLRSDTDVITLELPQERTTRRVTSDGPTLARVA